MLLVHCPDPLYCVTGPIHKPLGTSDGSHLQPTSENYLPLIHRSHFTPSHSEEDALGVMSSTHSKEDL